jgi:3-methyladenine DNA glycosylase AlkD
MVTPKLTTAADVQRALRRLASPKRAAGSAWFFKCGKGEYGEGDVFIGVTVPQQRAVAKKFAALPLPQAVKLLRSKIHEDRLTALLILVAQSRDDTARAKIRRQYLKNVKYVNNWDLVDSSAEYIVGNGSDIALLEKLAASKHLWSRRIAMIATYHHIKQGSAKEALRIAGRLVADEHDLIHKAVGWMLREVGKRAGRAHLLAFLRKHAATMPRTMLRYAIEHLPKPEREYWMRAAQRERL